MRRAAFHDSGGTFRAKCREQGEAALLHQG